MKRPESSFARSGQPLLLLGLLALSAMPIACGGESERSYDAPELQVPPGTPVMEHAVAAAAERADVAVVREIEYRDAAVGTSLGLRSTRLGAVADGRLVVLDGEARSLTVFDDSGQLMHRWGDAGTEEGRLHGPVGLAVVGDEVVVADPAAMRLSRWRLDGSYVAEVSSESLELIDSVVGSIDGGMLVKVLLRTEFDDLSSVTLFSLEGREQRRYIQLLPDYSPLGQSIWPRPDAVASPGGRIYATEASEYDVWALEPDGSFAWVLRVPWPRLALSEEAKRTIERTRRAGRALGANVGGGRAQPQALPALAAIEVDGADRLYVFPYVDVAAAAGRFPVDVYDPVAGRRLAAGWLPFQGWDAQMGSVIYRIETAADGATVVARYRLVWE